MKTAIYILSLIVLIIWIVAIGMDYRKTPDPSDWRTYSDTWIDQ